MTADIEMLPLYAELQGHPKLEIVKHYARANVEHHTAAKDAEIEALRAEVATWEGLHASEVQVRQRWQARAERLAEALRWYANPEVYKPHPHGPAFDDRDLSFKARAALRDHDQEVGNG